MIWKCMLSFFITEISKFFQIKKFFIKLFMINRCIIQLNHSVCFWHVIISFAYNKWKWDLCYRQVRTFLYIYFSYFNYQILQGTILDRIDYNVEQASIQVEKAVGQLQKVSHTNFLSHFVLVKSPPLRQLIQLCFTDRNSSLNVFLYKNL